MIECVVHFHAELPPETASWNRVEQTAHEVFSTFGFGEIRPPIFEPTELFARAVGGETDIVSKEMYTFKDYDTSQELQGLWILVFRAKKPNTYDETLELARGGLLAPKLRTSAFASE